MIYDAIRTRLLSSATIRDAVGTRIFRLRARQNTQRPFITVQQISKVPVVSLLGDEGTYFCRYQVNCFHDDPEANATLAAEVRAQLSGWQELDGTTIRSDLLNETDQIDNAQGNESGVSHVLQDYELNYAEVES